MQKPYPTNSSYIARNFPLHLTFSSSIIRMKKFNHTTVLIFTIYASKYYKFMDLYDLVTDKIPIKK